MSAINDVISTLKKHSEDLKKLGLGRVYSVNFAPSGFTKQGTADVMISEVTQAPSDYGSDDFTHNIQTIQLNIFYGNSFSNMDAFEDSIASFLNADKWILLPSGGHYQDPNTRQVTKVIQFKRRKIRWKLQD